MCILVLAGGSGFSQIIKNYSGNLNFQVVCQQADDGGATFYLIRLLEMLWNLNSNDSITDQTKQEIYELAREVLDLDLQEKRMVFLNPADIKRYFLFTTEDLRTNDQKTLLQAIETTDLKLKQEEKIQFEIWTKKIFLLLEKLRITEQNGFVLSLHNLFVSFTWYLCYCRFKLKLKENIENLVNYWNQFLSQRKLTDFTLHPLSFQIQIIQGTTDEGNSLIVGEREIDSLKKPIENLTIKNRFLDQKLDQKEIDINPNILKILQKKGILLIPPGSVTNWLPVLPYLKGTKIDIYWIVNLCVNPNEFPFQYYLQKISEIFPQSRIKIYLPQPNVLKEVWKEKIIEEYAKEFKIPQIVFYSQEFTEYYLKIITKLNNSEILERLKYFQNYTELNTYKYVEIIENLQLQLMPREGIKHSPIDLGGLFQTEIKERKEMPRFPKIDYF